MRALFSCEMTKLTRRVDVIAIMLIPFFVLLFSLLNPRYLYQEAMNWWSLLFAPFTAALIGIALSRTDKAQTQQNIIIHAHSLKKVWIAKVFVGVVLFFIATLTLSITASIVGRFFGGMPSNITISQEILTVFIMFVSQLWLVPFTMFLSARFAFPWTLVATLVGVIGAVVAWMQPVWWLWPWAWGVCGIIPTSHILPNGLLASADSTMLSPLLSIIAVLLGITANVTVTIATAWRFEKKYIF